MRQADKFSREVTAVAMAHAEATDQRLYVRGRLLKRKRKGWLESDLRKYSGRIAPALYKAKLPFTDENILASLNQVIEAEIEAEKRAKMRAPMARHVLERVVAMLPDVTEKSRAMIAGLVAFELEQHGPDFSDESIAEVVAKFRAERPKLFARVEI